MAIIPTLKILQFYFRQGAVHQEVFAVGGLGQHPTDPRGHSESVHRKPPEQQQRVYQTRGAKEAKKVK